MGGTRDFGSKHTSIKSILRSSVYMEESGFYQMLYKSLFKLSKRDLANLKLLNDIQRQDGIRKGMLMRMELEREC